MNSRTKETKPRCTEKGCAIDATIASNPGLTASKVAKLAFDNFGVKVTPDYVAKRLVKWHGKKPGRMVKVYDSLSNMSDQELAIVNDQSNIDIVLKSATINSAKFEVDLDSAQSESLLRMIDGVRAFIAKGCNGDVKSFLVQRTRQVIRDLKRKDRIGGQCSLMRNRFGIDDFSLISVQLSPLDEAIYNEEISFYGWHPSGNQYSDNKVYHS